MKIIALALIAVSAFAQPAVFPGAVVTDTQLGIAKNITRAQLSNQVSLADTTFNVTNSSCVVNGYAASCATAFVPNMFVVLDNEAAIICGVVPGSVTTALKLGASSCPNIDGRGWDSTVIATHNAAIISSIQIAKNHNQLAKEVESIETTLGPNLVNIIPLQPISCFPANTCAIDALGGSLIWTNPATVPAGVVGGLKINVSNNIGATPGVGNAVALSVRQTNDPPLAGGPGLISSSLWGADIISQQGTQTYAGSISIVVVSGTATCTTPGIHNLNAAVGYTPDFVTFTGTGNSILNGTVWTVATVPTTTTFTFASLTVPDGVYSGTMITATTNRVIEAEIQSSCVTANIQLDAFNGTGCRANGIEIISLAGSQLLTSALTTNTNTSDPTKYWNNGIELARIKGVGLEFRELDTPGSAFQIASIWDLSFSPTVLKVTGIHTTILDVSGLSGSLTNLINLGSAGPTNFVLGAGQPINFTNLKMHVVGPALSGAGNEALSVTANGAVFGVRHGSGSGLDMGVFTSDNLNLLTGTGLFFPALGINPGGNQPVCINSTTKRIYEGTGGGC